MMIITLHNDSTGNGDIASYDYSVYINCKQLTHGHISNHVREDGWQKLLVMLLEAEKQKSLERGFGQTPEKALPKRGS